jgi:hypothetical protein
MPNWCDNNLFITHDDPKMIKKLVKAWEDEKFFKAIYPEPDYSVTPVPKTYPEINAEFADTEEEKAKILANEPTIREDSWWDWRVQNWGVKWDIDTKEVEPPQITDEGKSLFCYFNTAWAPAIGIYDKLTEQGYQVEAYYFESGMAFCGKYTSKDGDQGTQITFPEDISKVELNKWLKETINPDVLENMDILSCYDCDDWQLEEEEHE